LPIFSQPDIRERGRCRQADGMTNILEMGAWIAAIAVLPLTVIGWFFASAKKKINKSQSRDGIAVSGVSTGHNSPVSVLNLTVGRDDNQ
jgi:hypothetical protein